MSSQHKVNPVVADPVVSRHPRMLGGAPCFAGTRVPIKALFDHLLAGRTLTTFPQSYPSVEYGQAAELLARISQLIEDDALTV